MRLSIAVLVSLLSATGAQAQGPSTVTYQGRLMDANGAPKFGPVSVQFAVFDDETNAANRLWCEKQVMALTDGYYVAYLGSGVPCDQPGTGSLAAAFAGPNRYLELTVEGSVLAPRTRIAAVPFALAAASIVGPEYIKAQTAAPQPAGFNIAGTASVTGPAPFTGSGRVTTFDKSNTLQGLDTRFGTEVLVGDLLVVGGQSLRVSAIADADTLTVDGTWSSNQSNVGFQVQKPSALFSAYSDKAVKPPPALVISAEGSVGIATATPRSALHVAGGVRIDSPPKTGIRGLELNRIDEDDRTHAWTLWHMDQQYGKNSLQFWEYRSDSSGKVCDSTGGAMCNKRFEIQSGGDVIVGGQVTATSFATSSSRSFKEGIRELEGHEALSALSALRPSRYRYKREFGGEEHLGFVAEEVPTLVRSSDGKAVKTGDIVALLAKVAQEQQRVLQQQEAMLSKLGAENGLLRSRIETLERQVPRSTP